MTENISENLSANTLFHFTSSLDILKRIIKNGFKISFVAEDCPKNSSFYVAPMVCFCDIPLGSVKKHSAQYGNYGIGIHKSICKNKKINPVFYVYKPKHFTHMFPAELGESAHLISYVKKYYGEDFKRRKRYKFYNEREWRYVEADKTEVFSKRHNNPIAECISRNTTLNSYLRVPHNRIEYIIVKNKNEILPIVNFIDTELLIPDSDKVLLHTKIISATRIKNDF